MSASRRRPTSRFQPGMAAMYACTGALPSAFAICGLPPASSAGLGLRLLRSLRLARPVEGDRLANDRLEGSLVNVFSFVDVDRAPDVPVEARVEETNWILQRRTLGKGKLHNALIGFAGADDAVARPNRSAGFGWFDPLPLFDDVWNCVLDERAH